jgi:hypothetical protein
VKALTIRQPWADAIAQPGDNPKRTENRSRRTNYTGQLLIHAGLGEDVNALPEEMTASWPDTRGAIIAVAELTGCHQAAGGCCAPWGFPDTWHWQLADVRPVPVPVPCRGQLGLWTPTPDLLAAVEAQYTQMEVVW